MGTTPLAVQHLALSRSSVQAPVQSSQGLAINSSRQLTFLRQNPKNTSGIRSSLKFASGKARAATLYDILELPPDVGLSDIKKAYRQLARRYHPDVCSIGHPEESTRRFIEIQEAYETLSDPGKRAVYDHAVTMGRGSASTGRMPWSPSDQACQPADWKSQWERQLFELRCQSTMRARRTDSWAAQMRIQNDGLHDI